MAQRHELSILKIKNHFSLKKFKDIDRTSLDIQKDGH